MPRGKFHPCGPANAGLEARSAGHAGEFEGTGVTVNVVAPGGPTDMPDEAGFDLVALVPPSARVPPILRLCSEADGAHPGHRYIAVSWDASADPEAAARGGRAPAAWPGPVRSPAVRPGGKPEDRTGGESRRLASSLLRRRSPRNPTIPSGTRGRLVGGRGDGRLRARSPSFPDETARTDTRMSGRRLKIAITRERREDEPRVAATPETVSKLLRNEGVAEVCVERGAGAGAGILDCEYEAAGAKVLPDPVAVLDGAAVQFAVRAPPEEAIPHLPRQAVLVGMLDPYRLNGLLETYAEAGLTTFSLELLPRVTRAQAMDVLSSQSNLAGYKAVIDAAAEFERAMPMMMTAAGTVPPARALVMGAGVAGLQAIATARRLGAIVSATDVRPAAREQVESLGATFIGVESAESERAETEGGYAREMSEDYRRRQAELFASELRRQDLVIGTALVPGRPAPRLIDAAMVTTMRKGSIIVDLAAEHGGNCELSRPGERVVTGNGVTILAHRNVPGRLAASASALYARNLLAFVTPLLGDGSLRFDWDDEILAATVLTRDGAVVHPRFQPAPPPGETGAGAG